MSALGQKRTSKHVQSMSALPPKADIANSISSCALSPASSPSVDKAAVRDRRKLFVVAPAVAAAVAVAAVVAGAAAPAADAAVAAAVVAGAAAHAADAAVVAGAAAPAAGAAVAAAVV